MISDSEVLAGLAFLASHADPRYREFILSASAHCVRVRKELQLDELRLRPAADLEISIRLSCALDKLGIGTVGALEKLLQDHQPSDLLKSREAKKAGFGKKCLREAQDILLTLGLRPSEAPSDSNATGVDIRSDANWLSEHAAAYRGQWVALQAGELVAADDSFAALKQKVDQVHPEKVLYVKLCGWEKK